MQLRLTSDELQLAIGLLELRSSELMKQAEEAEPANVKEILDRKMLLLEAIEERLIARDLELSADELDTLAAELRACNREALAEVAPVLHGESPRLQERQRLLERTLDKVVEACAMA